MSTSVLTMLLFLVVITAVITFFVRILIAIESIAKTAKDIRSMQVSEPEIVGYAIDPERAYDGLEGDLQTPGAIMPIPPGAITPIMKIKEIENE